LQKLDVGVVENLEIVEEVAKMQQIFEKVSGTLHHCS